MEETKDRAFTLPDGANIGGLCDSDVTKINFLLRTHVTRLSQILRIFSSFQSALTPSARSTLATRFFPIFPIFTYLFAL